MVTAELAIGMLTLGIATVMVCWVVSLVVLQSRCADSAAQVARQLARGDEGAAALARERAPQGSRASTTFTGTSVAVRVEIDARLGRLGPVRVAGGAVAALEPGVSE